MNSIEKKQKDAMAEIAGLSDWIQRYEYIIGSGKELNLPNQFKCKENLLTGCQSLVWIVSFLERGKVRYMADSNSMIVKGIMSLLLRVVDNESATDIVNADFSEFENSSLKDHFVSRRGNIFVLISKSIKEHAKKYVAV